MEVFVQDLDQCIPLCRKDLLKDVCERAYGDIDQIWALPGHFFITSDHRKKLFTFDCKPLSFEHAFDSRNLDLSNVSNQLFDVVLINPKTVALKEKNGHVQYWTLDSNFSWTFVGQSDLCTTDKSEIDSVAYLKSLNLIIWCEKKLTVSVTTVGAANSPTDSFTYRIYKTALPQVISSQDDINKITTSIFLHNCPPCDILAIASDLLFVRTRYDPDQISLNVLVDFPNDVIQFYAGSYNISFPGKSADNFQEIIGNHLSQVLKVYPGRGDLGLKADLVENQVAILSSDKQVEFYTSVSESQKRKVTRETIELDLPAMTNLPVSATKCIYRLKDGKEICQSDLFANSKVERVISSQCPLVLAWILTSDRLLALQFRQINPLHTFSHTVYHRTICAMAHSLAKRMEQGTKSADKEHYSDIDQLPDEHILQTDILKLVKLHELKMKDYNFEVIQELQEIQKCCSDKKNVQSHSQIATLIAPYLEGYCKLDNLSKTIVDSKMITMLPQSKSSPSAVQAIMENRNFSTSSRHAKLLWLSQIYPQELLDYLCQGINIDATQVDALEMKRWQHLIGLEGSDLKNFEFVCRLLYQLYPEKLLSFVKCAESVSEHTMGVSAFVRKKHTLMYYKSACERLPSSQLSCNPPLAASVKAKLILASQGHGCFEKALKHLLEHQLWSEAIQMIEGSVENKENLTCYLHIAVTALADNQVLVDFVPQLFAIFPTWKSVLSFANITAEQSDIRQQQLSVSAKAVFSVDSKDLKLASVKPYLLELFKKMSDN